MRFVRGIVLWLALLAPVCAVAQDNTLTPLPVLIIDYERLFLETEFGRRISAELSAEADAIRAENDEIVAALTEEERSLTLRRPQMSAEAFRIASAEFDTKVQDIRRVRDAKEAALQTARVDGRARFEERVRSIVATVMIERGAVAVLEQRTVVLSVKAANITDATIARIDAELGDGTPLETTSDK